MPRPTVVVVPANNVIALSVVRSLGRAGFHVVAFVSKSAPARVSRHCSEVVELSHEPLPIQLLQFVRSHPGCFVIALGEQEILAFNEHRAALTEHATLLFPSTEKFARALNKDQTLEIAARIGVPVPRTVELAKDPDLTRCSALKYPVVVKPIHQDVVDFKAQRVDSTDELRHFLKQLHAHRDFLLVQEYCVGYGLGVDLLIHEGRVVLAFQHRRIREDPPSGGASTCCESEALDPYLYECAVKLLREMEWEGVAMVEYRFDPITGCAYLMEVNGRFWGSLPLALHAGADFPAALVNAELGEPDPPSHVYRIGVRCRNLVSDTRSVWTSLRDGSSTRRDVLTSYARDFVPGIRYFVWQWDDPLPAFSSIGNGLAKRLGSAARRYLKPF